MTSGTRIGILGGTFDPVHVGHVDTALAALQALALDRVLVMPSGTPPHRPSQPSASRFHRFAMTALAVDGRRDSSPATWKSARPPRPTPSTRWPDCTRAASPRRRFSSSPVLTRSQKLPRGAAIRRSSTWPTSWSSRGRGMRRPRSRRCFRRWPRGCAADVNRRPHRANARRRASLEVLRQSLEVLLVDAPTRTCRRPRSGDDSDGRINLRPGAESASSYIGQHGLYSRGTPT